MKIWIANQGCYPSTSQRNIIDMIFKFLYLNIAISLLIEPHQFVRANKSYNYIDNS